MSTCSHAELNAMTSASARASYISANCDQDYHLINFVGLYYNVFNQNNWLFILLILTIVPLIFIHMNLIADQWMAISMRKLAKKLKFSPAVSAVTITSFAAGAPDLMSIVNNAKRPEGSHIGVGLLLGSFLFCTTLVISNVLFSSVSNIKLEKYPVIKEMSFYLGAIFVIVLFGLYGAISYWFIAIFLIMYVGYIWMTIEIDSWKPDQSMIFEKEEEEEEQIMIQQTKEYHDHYELRDSKQGSVISEYGWDDLIDGIKNEVHDDRKTGMVNLVCYPLSVLGLLAIPYSRNPLLKTRFRYVIYVFSCFFLIDSLLYFAMTKWSTFNTGLFIAGLISFVDAFGLSKKTVKYFQIFQTIACSILALKLYVMAVLDCIVFLSFFYAIDDLILSALLLSAGDSMGDMFSNSALAHQGEIGMASLACFANQNFNMMLGLSANLIVNLRMGVDEFDIFGLRQGKEGLLMRHWFMLVLIGFCLVNIGVHWSHYIKSNFHLEKSFVKFLIWEYITFFVVAVVLAWVSHVYEF